jgi:hypothetical protein
MVQFASAVATFKDGRFCGNLQMNAANKVLAAVALIAVTLAAAVFATRNAPAVADKAPAPPPSLPAPAPVVPQPMPSALVAVATPTTSATESGFVPLFNGQDLTGWTGSTDLYSVESGSLVYGAAAKGNLYTVAQFSNLDLRFEYKLTGGADNGIGIRSPRNGDPGFVGMEIQLLDASAEKFQRVAPWQSNGSVCGVVVAKQGYQKPVGEWNSEEILAIDRHITVILNGFTVVDAELSDGEKPKNLDGKSHPGLSRTGGHIVLMGDTPRVEFRNIRVRDLGAIQEPPLPSQSAQ